MVFHICNNNRAGDNNNDHHNDNSNIKYRVQQYYNNIYYYVTIMKTINTIILWVYWTVDIMWIELPTAMGIEWVLPCDIWSIYVVLPWENVFKYVCKFDPVPCPAIKDGPRLGLSNRQQQPGQWGHHFIHSWSGPGVRELICSVRFWWQETIGSFIWSVFFVVLVHTFIP